MGFDEEWARIKADARDEIARTQLNSTSPAGGEQGELVVHSADISAIGVQADELATSLQEHGLVADNPTRVAGILLRTPGFETGRALTDVAEAWQSQVETLTEACLGIAGHLHHTVTDHAGGELENQAELVRARTSETVRHITGMA
ncbi:hypothetical protein N0X72_23085 [Streptomyces carpaticus]|uniref:Uncharacterized protein n=2 Tax=Streptomyces TaxID=1883 RepID=A0A1I6VWR1_9ACTN|nr:MULTISPECIES: hypothetical protein [Streptomyces]MCK1815949.1 hypothetical protein [Streptomyces sp. XM4011]UWM51658.1 hypothetical protein N0X72_23085 [Streptomyces carpaticus]SFT18143.1 hypothetical protein SAMN05444716_110137 [Streptomyces harbinensis]